MTARTMHRVAVVAAGVTVSVAAFVVLGAALLVAAALYGPAWASLEATMGPWGASAAVAAITAAPLAVLPGLSLTRKAWNTDPDGR